MLHALTHLSALGLLAALLWATGVLVERAAGPFEVPALGGLVVRCALGSIAWIWLLFGLASAQALRPGLVLPLALGALLASVALRPRPAAGVQSAPASRLAGWAWCVPPAVVLLALFVRALSPAIGWDDGVYHLALPKLYLAHGGFRPVAFNVFSHWPHGIELLYALAMMVQDYVLAKLVHLLFLVLVLISVFRISRTLAPRSVALLATLLVLGNDVVLFEAERAYVDLAFAFFLLVAVAGADEFLSSGRAGALTLSGLCCGGLAATKLSGVAAAACVAAVVLLSRRPRGAPGRARRVAVALGIPTLLMAAPWWLKSYLDTGNPVYPFLYDVFGGREWSAELSRQLREYLHGIGMGRGWRDYLLLPFRVAWSGGPGYQRFDGRLGEAWLLLVPLALLVRSAAARAYLLCAGLYFGLWALTSQQMRLLIPVLPLLAVACAGALGRLAAGLRPRPVLRNLHVAWVAGTCALLLPALWPILARAPLEARELWRRGAGDPVEVMPEGFAFVNRSTPPGARILLLNLNQGFFLEREYLADSIFEASQMRELMSRTRSGPELHSRLRELGVTHLYRGTQDWRIRYPEALDQLLDDSGLVERAYECRDASCTIFALRAR